MDGSEVSLMVSADNVQPNGVAIDVDTDTVYWLEYKMNDSRLKSCGMSCLHNPKTVLDNSGLNTTHLPIVKPFDLKISRGHLYFSDRSTSNYWNIKRVKISSAASSGRGQNVTTVATGHVRIYGLTVVDTEMPRHGGNQCMWAWHHD